MHQQEIKGEKVKKLRISEKEKNEKVTKAEESQERKKERKRIER